MFPLGDGPSQMPPSPEISKQPLDKVNIRLFFCFCVFSFVLHSKALRSTCESSSVLEFFQRFPKVLLFLHSCISDSWMMVLDAIAIWGTRNHWCTTFTSALYALHSTESGGNVMIQCTLEGKLCNLQFFSEEHCLKRIRFFSPSHICRQTGEPLPISAPRLSPYGYKSMHPSISTNPSLDLGCNSLSKEVQTCFSLETASSSAGRIQAGDKWMLL